MKSTSKSFELNYVDIIKMLRNYCIFYMPVLVYINTQIQSWWTVDWYLFWTMVLWTTIDWILRYVKPNNTNEK